MNTIITLKVVPTTELKGREVLTVQPPAIRFFWDHGNNTYLCGKCNAILAEDVGKLEIKGKVLKCNKCNSYNAVKKTEV